MAVVGTPQPYYFNEVTKLCTGHEELPLTWAMVRDADGQGWTVGKVTKIFLLIVPMLIVDLYRMALNAWKNRNVVSPPNPTTVVSLIENHLQHVQIPIVLVLSYLDPHSAASLQLDPWTFAMTQLNPSMTKEKSATYQQIVQFDACMAKSTKRAALAENKLKALMLTELTPPSSITPDAEIERLIKQPRFAQVAVVALGQTKGMTHRSVSSVARTLGERLISLQLNDTPPIETVRDRNGLYALMYNAMIHNEPSAIAELHGAMINDEAIQEISAHCPNIQSISLASCQASQAVLLKLIQKCSQIASFSITKPFLVDQLELSNNFFLELASKKKLIHFEVAPIPRDVSDGISAILTNCPLTTLRLQETDELPQPAIAGELLRDFIEKKGSKLIEFSYRNAQIPKPVLQAIALHCPQLEIMNIQPAADITYDEIRHLLSCVPSLRTLTFCGNLSEKELLELTPHLKQLQKFRLLTHPHLPPQPVSLVTVLQFADRCPSLKSCIVFASPPEQRRLLKQAKPHIDFE